MITSPIADTSTVAEPRLDDVFVLRTTGERVTWEWIVRALPGPLAWWRNLPGNARASRLDWYVAKGWLESAPAVTTSGTGSGRVVRATVVSSGFARTPEVQAMHRATRD